MIERQLKVYEAIVSDPTIPEIRIRGKWLSLLGYTVGEGIQVSYEDGKLIIQLEPIITLTIKKYIKLEVSSQLVFIQVLFIIIDLFSSPPYKHLSFSVV